MPIPRRSRTRSASWPAATTPTPAPSRTRSSGSRRSPKPMACYPTRPSERATTRRDPRPGRGHRGRPVGRHRLHRYLRVRRGRIRQPVRAAVRAARGGPAARPRRAAGPGHLPGGGADRREQRGHDPPTGAVPAVRGQRIPARHHYASLPGLRRDRPAGHGQPPRPADGPPGDHVPAVRGPGTGHRSALPGLWGQRNGPCGRRRSPFASRPASRREPRCGWPGAECRGRCPAARGATRTRASGPAPTPGSPGTAPICGTTCTFRHPMRRSASPRPCPYPGGRCGSGCHREPSPAACCGSRAGACRAMAGTAAAA